MDDLETHLRSLANACQPTQHDTAVRKHMLQRLEAVLRRACPYVYPCTVEAYGSFASGFYCQTSDLDLAVCGQLHVGRMDPKLVDKMFGPNAPSPDQAIPLSVLKAEERSALLARITRCLPQAGIPPQHILRLLHARVPILKFKTAAGLECDLSIHSPGNTFKAQVLAELGKVSPVFPDLYRLVKQWAKAQDINDACAGTFNSHCLAMITIFYLQTCSPPCLPPLWRLLHQQQPAQEAPRLLAHGQPLDATVAALDVLKARVGGASRSFSGACQGLAQPLLAHFKGLLACMDSLLQRTVQEQTGCVLVSVWLGQLEVSSRTAPGSSRHLLLVEEPFDASDNCARTFAWRAADAQPWSLHYVADVFRRSSTLLSDAAVGKVSVPLALAALFGPSGLVTPPLAPVLAPLVTGTEALREVLAALVTAHHAKQPLMPAHRGLLQLLLEQGTGPASTGDCGSAEQESGEDEAAKALADAPAAAPAPPVGATTPQAGGHGLPEGVSLDTLIPAYFGSGLAGFKKHHSKPLAQQQRRGKGQGPLPSQATASQGVVPAVPTSAAAAVPEPGQGPGPGPGPNPAVVSGGSAAPGLASEAQLAAWSSEAPTASHTAATTALNPTLHQPAPRPPPQPSPAQQQRHQQRQPQQQRQRHPHSLQPSDPSMAERDESVARALRFASIASGRLQGQGGAMGHGRPLTPPALPDPVQAHAPSSVAPSGQGLDSLHTDLRLGLDSSLPAAQAAPPHSAAAAASMAAQGRDPQAGTQQQQYSQHAGGSAPSEQQPPHAKSDYQPVLIMSASERVLVQRVANGPVGQAAESNGLPEEQQAGSSLGPGVSLRVKGRTKQPRHGRDKGDVSYPVGHSESPSHGPASSRGGGGEDHAVGADRWVMNGAATDFLDDGAQAEQGRPRRRRAPKIVRVRGPGRRH
ncbi:hypothetical protein V8C86DRAFT_2738049 [Haematococcus lacustris]